MSKIKNGAEPFKQQQFGTAGVEGVKYIRKFVLKNGGNYLYVLVTFQQQLSDGDAVLVGILLMVRENNVYRPSCVLF